MTTTQPTNEGRKAMKATQYIENSKAAQARFYAFCQSAAGVAIEDNQTLGQILWSNRGVKRTAVEKAVSERAVLVGYRAGAEVYSPSHR